MTTSITTLVLYGGPVNESKPVLASLGAPKQITLLLR